MAGVNVAYGDVKVEQASVESQSRATVAQIVEIARGIWGEVQASGVDRADDRGNDRLYGSLREQHKDFSVSYPLVLRWMIQAREFDPKVFEQFLVKHGGKTMHRDRQEFLKTQGEYLVMIYKKNNKHHGNANEYRASIQKQLLEEDKEFTEKAKEAEELVKDLDAAADQERRERMYSCLMARRKREAAAAPG